MKLLLTALVCAGTLAAQSALFNQIDPIVKEIADLTGLPMKQRVDRDFITKERLQTFVETRIKETVSPEQLRVETLFLRLFGFIPEGYDLKGSTVALLTEQAAAFYDYHKKKMFILDSAPEATQQFVLTHELAHALADQHFNLEKFVRQGRSDDAANARVAVMEGQAQWIMYELMTLKTGQSLRKDPSLARLMANLGDSGLSAYPELSNAPIYIRDSLLFPYSRGLVFHAEVIGKLGDQGFREVFQRPPVSTRQILHPEDYFAGRLPLPAALDKAPKGFKALMEGSLGEFDCMVLFKQFGDSGDAQDRAAHWRGGSFRVLEDRKSKTPMLQFAIEWDSEESAQDFLEFYRDKVLPVKSKNPADTASVQRIGTRVKSTEGMR